MLQHINQKLVLNAPTLLPSDIGQPQPETCDLCVGVDNHAVHVEHDVRDVAPNALVLGNIGVVQAAQTETSRLADLVATCGADALVVHLNPAMEVVQPEGDDDFRGGAVDSSRTSRGSRQSEKDTFDVAELGLRESSVLSES